MANLHQLLPEMRNLKFPRTAQLVIAVALLEHHPFPSRQAPKKEALRPWYLIKSPHPGAVRSDDFRTASRTSAFKDKGVDPSADRPTGRMGWEPVATPPNYVSSLGAIWIRRLDSVLLGVCMSNAVLPTRCCNRRVYKLLASKPLLHQLCKMSSAWSHEAL